MTNHVSPVGLAGERPWQAPSRPWFMRMSWRDLLFAHWPVEPDALRSRIPAGLDLDVFESQAWIAVVPFRMAGVRPRRFPAAPGLSAFPELNLRTYVVADGKPGVWFFTLDATSRFAVRAARRCFHLPYCDAKIQFRPTSEGWIQYDCQRSDRLYPPATFRARYRPLTGAVPPTDDPLTHWLTARYCLYAADRRGAIWRSEVDHAAWPLEPAESVIEANTIAASMGIDLPAVEPHLLFSRRIDVVAWSLERVG